MEAIGLRTTRLRAKNGDLVVIPNGGILQVTNRSRDWSRVTVDVPVDLKADVDQAADALRRVGAEMADEDAWSGLLLETPSVAGQRRPSPRRRRVSWPWKPIHTGSPRLGPTSGGRDQNT